MKLQLVLFSAALLLLATPSLGAPHAAPQLSISSLAELSVPDQPYDQRANADAAIARAFALGGADQGVE